MMRPAILLGAVALAVALPAIAAELTIVQNDKQFDRAEVALKVGDALVFRNQDKVAHNVHSADASHRFDLGLQKPGDAASHRITAAGTFEVRCAIHPKMKLKVTAE